MGNGPYIDGLPINSMVIFHGYVKLPDFKNVMKSPKKLLVNLAFLLMQCPLGFAEFLLVQVALFFVTGWSLPTRS